MERVSFVSDGGKLSGTLYRASKSAPTLVLLHGLGFYSFEHEKLAPLLLEKKFNCLAFDFRGHGHSDGKRGDWKLQDLVNDTRHALDFVQKEFQGPIGLFGNSLGALVAVFTGAQDQRVKSIAACNCATKPSIVLFNPFRKVLLHLFLGVSTFFPFRLSVNHFIPYKTILDDPQWIAWIEQDKLIRDARAFTPETYYEMSQWDALKEVIKVDAPLLVIQGKRDRLQPVEHSAILYEAAQEPKRWMLIDSGHVPTLENPSLIADIIGDWFKQTLTRT